MGQHRPICAGMAFVSCLVLSTCSQQPAEYHCDPMYAEDWQAFVDSYSENEDGSKLDDLPGAGLVEPAPYWSVYYYESRAECREAFLEGRGYYLRAIVPAYDDLGPGFAFELSSTRWAEGERRKVAVMMPMRRVEETQSNSIYISEKPLMLAARLEQNEDLGPGVVVSCPQGGSLVTWIAPSCASHGRGACEPTLDRCGAAN